MKRVTRRILPVLGVLALSIIASMGSAGAFSQTDLSYYDGFQDLNGLDPVRSQRVALDALGGVRLATNGTPVAATWTTTADFTAPASPLGPMVGLSTLDAVTSPDTLKLPWSTAVVRRAQPDPVLSASASLSVDGYGVGGPCAQRVGDTYYLWYTGVPEDRFEQRIYLATSTDGGTTWAKNATPVVEPGASGEFDSRQLGRPCVIYDPTGGPTPSPSPSPSLSPSPSPSASPSPGPAYRMWYSAEGDFGGSIGYATSTDGVTWEKHGQVLSPGKPGMADSYIVSQPAVVYDPAVGIYRMWYSASDGNNRRIGYASSLDGVTWQRGGIVFDIGGGGNYSLGAWAPAVWRESGGDYHMIFTGAKTVAGGEAQTKLLNASTTDGGITWTPGNVALNPGNQAAGDFDGFNLSQPYVLPDPTDLTDPYKMWYVGNNPDANGNYHDRIGLAVGNDGSHWAGVSGGSGTPFWESILTLGTQSTVFDSMYAADLRPELGMTKGPGPSGYFLSGWFTGTNAVDFKPRIGVLGSTDSGATWSGSSVELDVGAAGFDAGGVAGPAPVWIDGTPPLFTDGHWLVYHTSLATSGASTIGLHKVDNVGVVTRYAAAVVPSGLSGTGFDSSGCADPALSSNGLFYAGKDGGGTWSLMRTTGQTGSEPPTFTGAAHALAAGPEAYDANGARHPVILQDGSTWHLWYAATGTDTVTRVAYATSTDSGVNWTKSGVAVAPSTAAYDLAEKAIAPAGVWKNPMTGVISLWLTGADRFGWQRVGVATVGAGGYLESGSATFELDHTAAQDWRRLLWNPTTQAAGTGLDIWVSYFPTYSGDWSQWMPASNDVDLPFLLTVQNIRWQVRMTSADPAATPKLDDLTINRAPVSFPTTGTAVSIPIGPPSGKYLLSWGDLTTKATVPGGTALTVAVEDEGGAQLVAPQAVNGGGATTVPLAAVPATSGRLVVVYAFTGDATTTPKIDNLGVTYTSTSVPSALTLVPNPALVASGGSTTLGGTLKSDTTPLAGQTVTIEARPSGATSYTPVGTPTTQADGSFTLAGVKVTTTTVYKASWPGGDVGGTLYPAAVATARVDVKAKVTLTLANYTRRAGKYRLYPAGRKIIAKGAVTPNHAKLDDGVTAGKVTIRAYRLRSGRWRLVKTATRTLSATSAYSWSWTTRTRGTYRFRTSFAGDTNHPAARSVYRYAKVY